MMMEQVNEREGFSYRLRKLVFIFFSILTSGKRSAYYVLWIKFLQVVGLPFDHLFALVERVFSGKKQPVEPPVVFVVGIQRTGSTLVSQSLADAFPFFPIGNFSTIFRKSTTIPYRLAKFFHRRGSKRHYRNYYGISTGLFAIGDAYEFWDQWFGRDHYTAPLSVDRETSARLHQHLSKVYRSTGKPLITKNNRNSLMVSDLYRIFPRAFFVLVEREALPVIRSTIKASGDFFGSGSYLWGLLPHRGFDPNRYESITEAATVQYLELKRKLDEQVKSLPEESWLAIHYDEFCRDPQHEQQRVYRALSQKYGLTQRHVRFRQRPFASSRRLQNSRLDKEIRHHLDKWNKRYSQQEDGYVKE